MKFEIPFPCSEDLDKMKSEGLGKFCSSCSKVVIDFTKMSLEEIQSYFTENQNKSICGIFKTESIDNIELAIPLEIVQKNHNKYRNLFILAFLVAFGFLNFGCNGNAEAKKEDKIEHITTGIRIPNGPMIQYNPKITDSSNKEPKKLKEEYTLGKTVEVSTTTGAIVSTPILNDTPILKGKARIPDNVLLGEPAYIPPPPLKKDSTDSDSI